MASEYLKPSSKGYRAPTSNSKQNGNIMNPPRFPEIGGMSGAGKGPKSNSYKIKAPK